jgi:HlyD family secretion protein
MKFSLRTLIWTVVLLAMILAGAMAMIRNPVDVEFATVTEGPLRVSVQEDGKTRIREKYVVSAPVAGRLSRIELESGDAVQCDTTLLAVIQPSDPEMLDARASAEAEARAQSAQAALRRAESRSVETKINYDLDKTKFDRAEKLRGKAITQDEYDIAKAEFLASAQAIKSAKFDTEIAKFELQMAQAAARQFDETEAQSSVKPFELRAPIGGKVLRVFQESSSVVSVGTPLLELGDPANLEIEIDVLSTDAVRIKPGAELTIEHWGGESPLRGNVRTIEPAAFRKVSSLGVEEQRVNIIADFNETPERIATLGDGYRIEGRITINELSNALLIPNSALFRNRRQWNVMKIVDNKAVMQPVTIGLQNETHAQISQGLQQGDQVIVYPSEEVQAGTKVRPLNRE